MFVNVTNLLLKFSHCVSSPVKMQIQQCNNSNRALNQCNQIVKLFLELGEKLERRINAILDILSKLETPLDI